MNAGRVPSAQDILTWMDGEHQKVNGNYLNLHSKLQAFKIENVFDIMEIKACFLTIIRNLRCNGATMLH